MNWKAAIFASLTVVPLVLVLALGFGHDAHEVPSVLEGKPAAAFNLRALDGNSFALSALRGKPVVLNFWATWCYPCQAEHLLLQEAAQYYGSRVQFLGVIYQDQPEAVQAYLKTRPNHYPQLIDLNSRMAIDYGVAGVPESFIINPNGQIVHKEAGVLSGAILRQYLDAMVGAGEGR